MRRRLENALEHRYADVLFTILFLIVMVQPLPMFPDLNQEGLLDGINRAIANHLLFGWDIVLTHGPYAPVYTSQYYPGTEFIRLLGQILIALSYSATVLTLFRGVRRLLLVPCSIS